MFDDEMGGGKPGHSVQRQGRNKATLSSEQPWWLLPNSLVGY